MDNNNIKNLIFTYNHKTTRSNITLPNPKFIPYDDPTKKISLISFDYDTITFKFLVDNSQTNYYISLIQNICKNNLYRCRYQINVITPDKNEINVQLIKTPHSELILNQYENLTQELFYIGDYNYNG